jgi:hypothetical protein
MHVLPNLAVEIFISAFCHNIVKEMNELMHLGECKVLLRYVDDHFLQLSVQIYGSRRATNLKVVCHASNNRSPFLKPRCSLPFHLDMHGDCQQFAKEMKQWPIFWWDEINDIG